MNASVHAPACHQHCDLWLQTILRTFEGAQITPLMISPRDPVQPGTPFNAGLGGGASGAAAGLLHPFTSRGRPLWEAERAMPAAMQLLRAAEAAAAPGQAFCWHQDLLRPAADDKQAPPDRKSVV